MDYRRIRLEYEVKVSDLAKELLMSQGQYSMIESGHRVYKGEYRKKCFDEDFLDAIEKISRMNKLYDTDGDGLQWLKLTEERIQEAISLINQGKTVIQASIRLGVDEDLLKQELITRGILTSESLAEEERLILGA